MFEKLRVAIVHEWLVNYAGSERVVEQLLQLFPDAQLYAVVDFLSPEDRARFLGGRHAKTTFIQSLPKAKTHYRSYLPLMPLAIEQHDLSEYDLIMSSSHAVSKGVLTGPDQVHVSYVHSPMRYAWELQHQYLSESGLSTNAKGWVAKAALHYLRHWDQRTAHGVDQFIANSAFVARRISKVYGRDAKVIYPPVDTMAFSAQAHKKPFYLTVSRMVPYKKVSLIVEAFRQMPESRLVVIGDGPEYDRVKALAGPNVELLGFQPTEVLRRYMQDAQAFLFAAEEDFGITPVEAQACGTPVIAFGKGGALETVRGLDTHREPSGIHFQKQTVDSLVAALRCFEANRSRFTTAACRASAERFSAERFRSQMKAVLEEAWDQHMHRMGAADRQERFNEQTLVGRGAMLDTVERAVDTSTLLAHSGVRPQPSTPTTHVRITR